MSITDYLKIKDNPIYIEGFRNGQKFQGDYENVLARKIDKLEKENKSLKEELKQQIWEEVKNAHYFGGIKETK